MKEVIGMLKGIFLIICAATCWGMGGVAGQYLYQYHQADMIWLCMVRQILAGCMFLLFAAFVQKQDILSLTDICSISSSQTLSRNGLLQD